MKRFVTQYIARHQLLTKELPIIVGVSGGADSMALLHLLAALGYRCVVAHCNFRLRGNESDGDTEFVTAYCKKHGLHLSVEHFQTTCVAKELGVSIEMAARHLRYQWFEQLREQYGAQAIAVAHHADDQAETLLLNLVRGTGLKGLCGMLPKNGFVVRPLLACTRKQIERYLSQAEVDYVTDSTNMDEYYKRNKIRHAVVPLLQELNPHVTETLAESATRFTEYWQIAQLWIEEQKAVLLEKNAGYYRIPLEPFLTKCYSATVLYEILKEFGFNGDQVQQLFDSLSEISGKQFVSANHLAIKDRAYIYIYPKTEQPRQHNITFTIRPKRAQESFPAASAPTAFVDADKVYGRLTIRFWQEGDSFVPMGMKHRKKVSDFFVDQKLTIAQKRQIPLVVDGEEIIWIVGYRISDKVKVTAPTKHIMEIIFTN